MRAARDSDAAGIFPIAAEFATSFVLERGSFVRAFGCILRGRASCLLVGELDGRVVGYLLGFEHATFFANGPVAWVEEIAVASTHRRNGIGRALMAGFEQWAISRGSRQIALATRRAGAFYTALGYGESATYFRKRL